MMRFAKLLGVVLLLAFSPHFASAQVRAGLDVERLTPASMSLLDVQLAAVPEQPVRLVYAYQGQSAPVRFIDVYVGSSAADARRAFLLYLESLAVVPALRASLGHGAFGEGDLIAFHRDNIFVVLRDLEGGSVEDAASRIDRLIQRAPAGSPRAPNNLARLETLAPSSSRVHQFPRQVLAAHIQATSEGAAARRRGEGWFLSAGADTPAGFTVRVADRRLRQTDFSLLP